MATKTGSSAITEKELVIERTFNASREQLWESWTDPEKIKMWWGPQGYTAPIISLDLKVGGEYLYCMRSPEGKDYWSRGVFREIQRLERLVLTDSFADEKGNIVPASYYGMSEDFALESLVTVIFDELDTNRARLTLRYRGVPARELENAAMGWNESLDKLADHLGQGRAVKLVTAEPGKQELFIYRELNAPRELVYRAFTDAGLRAQWMGPRNMRTEVEKLEPRNGGSWRTMNEDEKGNRYYFHGVFHELSPELMISTFEYEGLPGKGHVSLETTTLETVAGNRTRLTVQSVFRSAADRDEMVRSGMEDGVRESYERLEELLKKMKQSEEAVAPYPY